MDRWLHSPIRRAIEVAIAGSALLVLSPVIAATAIGVRVRLGSPVLFRQVRAGRDDVPFDVIKFRTMTDESDADGRPLDDVDRLTPFGRRLRASSLDELPQLWAICRGQMSLIGPRPLPMAYLGRYSPDQRRRSEATPGLTGWAQVHGRNSVGWPERLALDVWYVDHASPRTDLRIVARTLRLLATRNGVSSAEHVTMPEFLGEN